MKQTDHKSWLAAIMFTDIVGYTSMMQKNQEEAMAAVKAYEAVLKERIARHEGELLQTYGDGSLSIFSSATAALTCAKEIQEGIREKVPLRIGLHIGEITRDGDHTFGSGVNLASRIESLGQTGTVLFSKGFFEKIRNQPAFHALSLGNYQFKNVAEPMEVFALANEGFPVPHRSMIQGKGKLVEATHEKTIAVLPFSNLSSDPEQEYFSDGLTEEVIADMSHVEALRVTSRTSVMEYKKTSKNIMVIGQELGVRYLLEGSVRKVGNRLRITAKLIDAVHDEQLWAEKYKGTLEDVFDLQEEVSRQIVAQLNISLSKKVSNRIANRPIENVQAYELYLQAKSEIWHPTEASLQKAMELVQRAEMLIGKNERLLSTKGYIHLTFINLGLKPDPTHLVAARKLVEELLRLNPETTEALFLQGLIQVHAAQRQAAIKLFQQVLVKDSDHADAMAYYIVSCLESGHTRTVYPYTKRLLELDPMTAFNYAYMGWYYLSINHLERSEYYYRKSYELDPNHPFIGFFYASFLPLAGKTAEAILILEKVEMFPTRLIVPHLSGFLKFALMGEKEKALSQVIPQLNEQASWSSNTCFQMARVYALLEEKQEMIAWLEMALDQGFFNYHHLLTYPEFHHFKKDEKFQQVLQSMSQAASAFAI